MTVKCPVQARCGGCPLLSHAVADQHALKIARVEQAFQTVGLGALPWAQRRMVHTHSEGYRSRLRMRLSAGLLTYFNEDKDPHCLVLSVALRQAMAQLRQALFGVAGLSAVQHLEVRAPAACGRPAALFTLLNGGAFDLRALAKRLPNWRLAHHQQAMMPAQRQQLSEQCYGLVPLNAFAQVHPATNRELIAALLSGAARRGLRNFAELFAGAGNFALPLAAAGLAGYAVERHPDAVEALVQAAREQRLPLQAEAADAQPVLARWAEAARRFELLLLNPPRAGLKRGYGEVARVCDNTLALVCCSATSIARDVAALLTLGFQLDEVQCFDMFPHTDHVEVLVWLSTKARC